ncbi:hypothetical protein PRUPE_2G194500 [Prunus persica]|uniref:Uncharacterized protein n=1 Tax=Prunus persica TaxID=3760 RepID=A0A251QIJ6_PRUPE|nr:hypothetical protein PRUPE_2G194500 [Prunus persica]ONI23551.1 hypothetical protein PRUPE_2G194500 [Prunus persica]ONI23552.1 hypothetical protein PRUPE_2G194500 [Prunus persica]ONI23553.1 hypothetical protein PRUPE_2G194500 [Prunus persica]ONI23554.1 hypothetical protein PRUPE_2G194500 [Prunus persica]
MQVVFLSLSSFFTLLFSMSHNPDCKKSQCMKSSWFGIKEEISFASNQTLPLCALMFSLMW